MEIIGRPSMNLWGKFFSCYYWKNVNGEHPKFNEIVTMEDICNGKWIPDDETFELCSPYLKFQNNLPIEKRQFGFPPFKMTMPLDPYDLYPESKKEIQNELFRDLIKILNKRIEKIGY